MPLPLLIRVSNLIAPTEIAPPWSMSVPKSMAPTVTVTLSAVFSSERKSMPPTVMSAVCRSRALKSAPPRLIVVPLPLLIRESNLIPPRLIVAVCLTSDLKFAPPRLIVAWSPSLTSEENWAPARLRMAPFPVFKIMPNVATDRSTIDCGAALTKL